ncbi:hypothetical protein ACQ4PT_029883 [Festuca glaucescens]
MDWCELGDVRGVDGFRLPVRIDSGDASAERLASWATRAAWMDSFQLRARIDSDDARTHMDWRAWRGWILLGDSRGSIGELWGSDVLAKHITLRYTIASQFLLLHVSIGVCVLNPDRVHSKKRNRLLHEKMRDLVFVKCNSKLIQKKANKGRDPIKEVDDVLDDDDNEFITGIVPTAESEETEVVQPQESEQVQASQGASTSGAQINKKTALHRKKRKRSMHSLLNSIEEDPVETSSPSSEDDDIDMHSFDSD